MVDSRSSLYARARPHRGARGMQPRIWCGWLFATVIATESPTRQPTTGRWNATIVVGTHHKTGTVLLAKIFRHATKLMGVPRTKMSNRTLSSACGDLIDGGLPGVCIIEHVSGRDVRHWLQRTPLSFVHAVRDPVEMCVSAYQYHLLGAEPWLTQPLKDLNGSTLQQYYRTLTPAEGVRFECKRMAIELVETALVFNATRARANTLTVQLEEFTHNFDGTARRLFQFLGSGAVTDALVRSAAQYDLAREPAEDARHVSSSSSKQPLRERAMDEPILGELLSSLRALLGYGHTSSHGQAKDSRTHLCAQLQALCATTHVGFFQWCTYGRILHGRLPSLPECGERNANAVDFQHSAVHMSDGHNAERTS